jgi:hypothetical protein
MRGAPGAELLPESGGSLLVRTAEIVDTFGETLNLQPRTVEGLVTGGHQRSVVVFAV